MVENRKEQKIGQPEPDHNGLSQTGKEYEEISAHGSDRKNGGLHQNEIQRPDEVTDHQKNPRARLQEYEKAQVIRPDVVP